MNIEERVFSYIEKYHMIEENSHVIVGISGGADSVCLLFLLKKYQKKKIFHLYGVHVNHNIRGEEATRDENYARSFCESLKIPFTVYTMDVPKLAKKEKISLEEAGRIARRKAFFCKAKEIKSKNKKVIALAHHENDNAETMLHNLIRGTKLAGLSGIRPCQITEDGVMYVRPMLCVLREEIETYLQEQQISWMIDSTNEEIAYTRNKIRHIILPEMEEINNKAVTHMTKTAQMLCEIDDYLLQQAKLFYKKYVKIEESGYRIGKGLSRENRLMQSYVVQMVLEKACGKKNLTATHIESVLALYKGRTGASVSLLGGIKATEQYGDLWIAYPNENKKPLPELEFHIFPWENQQIQEKTYTKWFDYDKINSSLEIRYRKQGDFLTVTREGGKKKLKDYFIDCKIPREERDRIPLLVDGSHVLWVIGYRISQYYKITDKTQTVLKVHVKGVNENE